MEIKALRTKKIKAAKIGILSQKMFLLMTVFIIGLVSVSYTHLTLPTTERV